MLRLLLSFTLIVFCQATVAQTIPSSKRSEAAIAGVEEQLKKQLEEKDLTYGAPIFIRIFKKPGVLELWVEDRNDGKYKLFKEYDICTFSGRLGPKQKQGDYQSPEGFYFVNAGRLNPWSSFHLSFNLGYPNKYDRAHGRTGSALMVHGNCVSIGCYAMTDKYIEEIYALADTALREGQSFFRVHVFPFKLEEKQLEAYKKNEWYDFWKNLKEGYDYFEEHRVPPNVEVEKKHYVFTAVNAI